jgi:hypothetical protein
VTAKDVAFQLQIVILGPCQGAVQGGAAPTNARRDGEDQRVGENPIREVMSYCVPVIDCWII